MKRFIAIFMAALFAATVFVGCGKTNPEGKYVIKSIDGKTIEDTIKEKAGSELNEAEIKEFMKVLGIESFEEYINLELKEGGSAEIKRVGEDAVTGKWEQKEGKLTLTFDGETTEGTLKGNELSFKDDGKEYVFVKK